MIALVFKKISCNCIAVCELIAPYCHDNIITSRDGATRVVSSQENPSRG